MTYLAKPETTMYGKHPGILLASYTLQVVSRNSRFVGEERKPLHSRLWWALKRGLSGSRNITRAYNVPASDEKDTPTTVSSRYKVIKTLISLTQMVYGVVTPYRTRGNQLSQYGYAAFCHTVTRTLSCRPSTC